MHVFFFFLPQKDFLHSNYCLFEVVRRDLTFDYDDELDALALLSSAEIVRVDGNAVIRLEKADILDADSFEIVTEIDLDDVEVPQGVQMPWVKATLDRDLLMVRVKGSGKTVVFVYRLKEHLDESLAPPSRQDDLDKGQTRPRTRRNHSTRGQKTEPGQSRRRSSRNRK